MITIDNTPLTATLPNNNLVIHEIVFSFDPVSGFVGPKPISPEERRKLAQLKLDEWYKSERNFALVTDYARLFANVYAMYQCLKNIIERNDYDIEIWYGALGTSPAVMKRTKFVTPVRELERRLNTYSNETKSVTWEQLFVPTKPKLRSFEQEISTNKELLAIWRRGVTDPVKRIYVE